MKDWTQDELIELSAYPPKLLVDMRLVHAGQPRTPEQFELAKFKEKSPDRFFQMMTSLEKSYGEQMARRAAARTKEEKAPVEVDNEDRLASLIEEKLNEITQRA